MAALQRMIMKLFAQDEVSPSPLPPLAQVGENKGFSDELKVSEFHRETLQNNRDPLCSIVCTTYNHAQYCLAAIDSILNQSYRPIELVIVDDGSCDNNVELIKRALEEAELPSLLIEKPNDGNVSRNGNIAIRHATGEVVVTFSLDDLLLPRCISEKMKLFAQNSKLAIVGNSCYAEISETGKVLAAATTLPLFGYETETPSFMVELEYSTIGTYFLQGTALRRTFLNKIGGFDEACSGDDLPFRTRAWKHLEENADLDYIFLPHPSFAYRRSKRSLHNDSLRQIITVIEWRNKYFPGRDLPLLAMIWTRRAFSDLETSKGTEYLRAVVAGYPELEVEYNKYKKSWLRRRRLLRASLLSCGCLQS
jgi:alpha-1,3-rhamnosyltransferase